MNYIGVMMLVIKIVLLLFILRSTLYARTDYPVVSFPVLSRARQ